MTGASRTVDPRRLELAPDPLDPVEVDELFVVLSGRATVEVAGGATLELAPGVVGLLRAGDRTTWDVHERLRKVYQLTHEVTE